MIRHYNHALHIGIRNTDALDLQEKLFLPPFSLWLKFIRETSQTWILIIISIPFVIGHCNHVHRIGIHNIDALDLQEMLFFPPFSLLLKFIQSFSFHHYPYY